ncbi:MAG: 5'/3'-nucleotidase SurE [Candidatus Lokiarchaeota archaeon]|nr:5'/3'-nucleotidase SurE [Candidatus Lokiarchaeota archaeon]
MTKICLANDDGPDGRSLRVFAKNLSDLGEVIVIVPDQQRSGSGKSMTLNHPLRIIETEIETDIKMLKHSGMPADSVVIANSFFDDIDIFIAGINAGANLGYQSMMTSGTVGIVMEAAILGYPAIAVSMTVNPNEWFNNHASDRDYAEMSRIATKIIKAVIKNGLPEGIDALNINFPLDMRKNPEIKATRPVRCRMANTLDQRIDPNQSPYYWIDGEFLETPKDTDAHVVLVEENVSVSPIIIETIKQEEVEKVKDFLDLLT